MLEEVAMSALELQVLGPLREHPLAAPLVREVVRVHQRYAREVVGAYQLCPFMKDPEVSYGLFCVILDRGLDLALARDAVMAATNPVIHLVFPCVDVPSREFERFSAKLGEELKKAMPKPPVSATFHPQFSGGRENPARLVGLLRRAPDPFVQFIPKGMHQGGTVFVGTVVEAFVDPAQKNFERLQGEKLDHLLALMEDIRADRDRSYREYLEKLPPAPV